MQAARHNSSIVGALAGAGADNVQVQTIHNVFHFIFVSALKSYHFAHTNGNVNLGNVGSKCDAFAAGYVCKYLIMRSFTFPSPPPPHSTLPLLAHNSDTKETLIA